MTEATAVSKINVLVCSKVAVVAEIGGSTVDETTRRMMPFITVSALFRQYNFVGRHGKPEF